MRRWTALHYRTCDLEITRPLEAIALSPEEHGVGILARRHGRPIGYLLKACDAGRPIPPELLGKWIAEEFGRKIIEEAIEEELSGGDSAAAMPSVTVAICTRARPDRLARCLRSLLPLQARHGFEILVIDNAPPDDGTKRAVAGFPGVRYAVEKLAGLDFARNRAWREAGGDWVAYLDDDATVDSGWFDGLQAAWRENPGAGAVTGLVLPLELSTSAQVLFERRGGFRRGFDPLVFGRALPENRFYPCGAGMFGSGCNMAFRREVLERLNGFDEALDTGAPLPGGGDLDIYYRVIRAGHVLVYEPRFLVFHEHRKSESALRQQYYTWGLGMSAYVRKNMKADPEMAGLFRHFLLWWIRHLLRELRQSLRTGQPLPPGMLIAEICGCAVGWFGEYERSQRRSQRIREAADE